MKKTYLSPQILVVNMQIAGFICGSKSITTKIGTDEMDYGGVDEHGTIQPSCRDFVLEVEEE